ncbi:MAG: hypothetical protein U1E69_01620 [Tabrizicola sp.]|uniref:hypothetical protein n=1 Tax=Tabrizicola sp. TaxID=2005166 RepID=UPI002AB81674|nr:hypothetical protein [Tabrizicola sp.]MDZ4085480.1 hypothetical protein [Tabrizicola sp.]
MHSDIAAELRFRGDLLLQGRIDALLDSYIFPLPIFLPEQRMLLSGPEEARLVFSLLRHWLLRSGVASLHPQVQAVELPRAGRFRMWVDWNERLLPSGETRTCSAIYYCRATELGPRIEMVNYTRLSMPELHQEFEALALSA